MSHEYKIKYNTNINVVNLKKNKFYNKYLKKKLVIEAKKQNIENIKFYRSQNLFNQILINDNYYIECNFNLIKTLAGNKKYFKIFHNKKVVAVYIKGKVDTKLISKLFSSKKKFKKQNKLKINCIDLSKIRSKKMIDKKLIKKKAIFIDRDGTINYDNGYTYKFKKHQIIPKTLRYLKNYTLNNNLIIIITNQAGIAKKKFHLKDFYNYSKKLIKYSLKKNIVINKIYFCPHHVDGFGSYKKNCKFRKPEIGMIKKGIRYFKLNKKNCEYIGNTEIDKLCANKAKILYKDVNEIKK